MLASYVTYCIRLPIGLGLGIAVLVAIRMVWIRVRLYRRLLRKRACKVGMTNKRVGPQALVLSRFGALFVALVGSLISVYTDADICKIAFSAE